MRLKISIWRQQSTADSLPVHSAVTLQYMDGEPLIWKDSSCFTQGTGIYTDSPSRRVGKSSYDPGT